MNTAQTIFSVFYAVLYGAIFTISDRWRPFTYAGPNNPEGCKRFLLSLVLLVLFPVFYFILIFDPLSYICQRGFLKLLLPIYLVSPLYAFFVLWVTCVSSNKNIYYSQQEQRRPPIRDSLFWISDDPQHRLYLRIFCSVLIVTSIIIRFWLLR